MGKLWYPVLGSFTIFWDMPPPGFEPGSPPFSINRHVSVHEQLHCNADFIPFIKAKSLFERVAYLASIRQGLIVIIFLKRLGELTFKCLLFKVLFLLLSFYTQHKGCNRYIQVHYNPHICWPFNPWTHV